MKGVLITFEGVEGCGKSTQAEMLFNYLHERGFKVFFTREPGGTAVGKKIRELLLNRAYEGLSNLAELFLYLADRAQHVHTVIKPHLDDGGIVICDRFIDSTSIYQGYGREINRDFIKKANTTATGGVVPDLTLIFDIDVAVGLKRRMSIVKGDASGGALDRIESETEQFHERLRDGFKSLAGKEKKRCRLIDGGLEIHQIQKSVREEVMALLKRRKLMS